MSESSNNSLSKIAVGLSTISIICIIVLFFKSGGSASGESGDDDSTRQTFTGTPGVGLKIGYFLNDSLNSRSVFVQKVQKDIEDATLSAEQRMAKKQKDIENWQRGWDARQPLLSTEQEKYMIEAQKMQQDAMSFEQNLQMELAQTQERLMITLVNRITMISKVLAENEGFDMIFSYQLGQNLIYIRPELDLTNKLCKALDEDYKSSSDFTGTAATNSTQGD